MSFDMGSILKQAKKLQEQMKKVQEELAEERIVHSTAGGLVKCTVSGMGEVLGISIAPEALAEGHEFLEDMVLVAVREALTKAHQLQSERFHSITGGMNLPGLDL